MREIKFRVWDKDRKKMVFGPSDGNDNASWVLAAAPLFKCEPMQFTGLKDGNGKEIYEGDIYECDDELTILKSIEDLYFNDKLTYPLAIEIAIVVGNIYENPELLEKAK